MRRVERRKAERTTEEIVRDFMDSGGNFLRFRAGLSLSEREKFNEYIEGLKKRV